MSDSDCEGPTCGGSDSSLDIPLQHSVSCPGDLPQLDGLDHAPNRYGKAGQERYRRWLFNLHTTHPVERSRDPSRRYRHSADGSILRASISQAHMHKPSQQHKMSKKERWVVAAYAFTCLMLYILFMTWVANIDEDHHRLGAANVDSPLFVDLDNDEPRRIIEVKLTYEEDTDATMMILVEGCNASCHVAENWFLLDWESEIISDADTTETYRFDTGSNDPADMVRIQFQVDVNEPVPFMRSIYQYTIVGKYQPLFAGIIFLLVIALLVTEVVHRTVAAMVGAFLSLFLLTIFRKTPDLDDVVLWVDISTIGLLMGMMIMVEVIKTTGFFEYVAVRGLAKSNGNKTQIVMFLLIFVGVVSAFLDNVTSILLIASMSNSISKVCEIPPSTLLIMEAIVSNVGGASTMIGDPPNIIIGSSIEEVTFTDFIIHLMPFVVLVFPVVYFYLRWVFGSQLEGKIPVHVDELLSEHTITNTPLLYRSGIVLVFAILSFCSHPLHELDVSWIAMSAAVLMMLLLKSSDLHHTFQNIEWETLLFFGALFVFVEGLKELDLIRQVATVVEDIIYSAPEDDQLAVALVIVLWVSAIFSAFGNNVPYAVTFVSVVKHLAKGGLPVVPLAFCLSLGACLGGNGTITGASANVVAAGISEHAGDPISFARFTKVGAAVTAITVSCATAYVLILYTVLEWY